ncbi:hypothetical protein Slala02_01090 [Streptomyces lavendulae subsp. lavendulae]|nr:hypothetical protein Slala01_64060 [Streptomyces lavendulae subsp. lavendulae]GLX24289.1 hypothetical protein Slala02_01090 [Streptomyces lavendulae subsp. lavendulae]
MPAAAPPPRTSSGWAAGGGDMDTGGELTSETIDNAFGAGVEILISTISDANPVTISWANPRPVTRVPAPERARDQRR